MATRGGRVLGDRQGLRHDVLRRPRPLRLHERGVRAVRPRERPAARHLPERHPVRGRDHRHGARPVPRRGGHRRRAGRPRHHAAAPAASSTPCSPTASTPRETRGITQPNFVKPETGHPAFDKALPPVRHRAARRRRSTRRPPLVDVDCGGRRSSTTRPIAIIGSACNYGYGTIDPIAELGDARARARRRPARRRLPRRVHPPVRPGARLRHPACSTSGSPASPRISADTHKYGYAFKGTLDAAVPRQGAAQRAVLLPAPTGPAASTARPAWTAPAPAACSPRRGRRWCQLGREGYRELRQGDLRDRRRDAGRGAHRTPSCASWARRRSASASPRDEFDIYHVNDFMRPEGLALQRPAVPERDPHGGHPPADPARRGRGVRRRPRRGRRLRQGEGGRRRGRVRRRDLRRRRRRARPTRPTSSSARSWPTCSTSSRPCRPRRADGPRRQLVLAVDLGTGGPKVGFVSLTGEVAWREHTPGADAPWLPGRRRRRRTPRSGGG